MLVIYKNSLSCILFQKMAKTGTATTSSRTKSSASISSSTADILNDKSSDAIGKVDNETLVVTAPTTVTQAKAAAIVTPAKPPKLSEKGKKLDNNTANIASSGNKRIIAMMLKNKKPVEVSSMKEVQDFNKKYKTMFGGYKEFDNDKERAVFIANYDVKGEARKASKAASKASVSDKASDTTATVISADLQKFEEIARKKNCDGKFLCAIFVVPFAGNVILAWRFTRKDGSEKWCHRYDVVTVALSTYVSFVEGENSVLNGMEDQKLIEAVIGNMKHCCVKSADAGSDEVLCVPGKDDGRYKVYQMYSYMPKPSDDKKKLVEIMQGITAGIKRIYKTSIFRSHLAQNLPSSTWQKMFGMKSQYWTDVDYAKVQIAVSEELENFFVSTDAEMIQGLAFGTGNADSSSDEEPIFD
jgi:hypothetical protein